MRLTTTTLLLLLAGVRAHKPARTPTAPFPAGTATLPSAFPPIPIPPGPVAIDPLPAPPHPPLGVFWPVEQPALPALTASAPSFAVTLGAECGKHGGGYDEGRGSGDDHAHGHGHAHAHGHAHGHHGGGGENHADIHADIHAHGHGHSNHTPTPRTRSYNFTILYAAGNPDGFLRRLTTINGQFPGPTIEALEGEVIEVHVHNGIDTPQSLHWHGLEQRGTNFMDGVPGITQCPIRPGESFTYRFAASAAGTYFYHSHYGNTMSDGLYGGLVVHSASEPLRLGRDYDADYLLFASDWYDTQSAAILDDLADVHRGYRGLPVVAMPDAIIVNGVGQVDCATTQAGVPCAQKTAYELALPARSRVRLRIVNPGGHATVRVSIDGHALQVIEADATALVPFATHEVPVNNGQRYSVVVALDQGEAGTAAVIRVNAATFCQNPLVRFAGFGVLRYTDAEGNVATAAAPQHTPWPDLADPQTAPCADFDDTLLVPAIAEDAPADTCAAAQLDSHSGVFLDPATNAPYLALAFNNTPYTNYINSPFFSELKAGRQLNASNVPSVTFDHEGTADLIVSDSHNRNSRPDQPPRPAAARAPVPPARPAFLPRRARQRHHHAGRHPAPAQHQPREPGPPGHAHSHARDVGAAPAQARRPRRVGAPLPHRVAPRCRKMAAVVVRPKELGAQVPPAEWDALCAGADVSEIGPRAASLFNARVPPQARRSVENSFDTRAVDEWRLRSERIARWYAGLAVPNHQQPLGAVADSSRRTRVN